MKRWLLILLVLVAFAAGAYLFWTTTPFFAFQEAAAAARDHDLPKFQERLDLAGFVEALLDDLLVHPAHTTPGLSPLQQEAATGAIILAKAAMEEELIKGVETYVGGTSREPHVGFLGEEPAAASNLMAANDLGELVKVTSRELIGSVGRLSQVVYRRMQAYAQAHRNTTPGRLLACRSNERLSELEQMLAENGLNLQNFRGISSYSTTGDSTGGETCDIGFAFFSPKVSRNVTIQFELSKGSTFSVWQIRRLSSLPQLFHQLGENYDYEMHMLVASSLSGISDEAVNNEFRAATNRITQSQAAGNLLEKLNITHSSGSSSIDRRQH